MTGDRKGMLITVAVLMMLWLTAVVNADAKEVFPSKPISIIVPYAPGGSLDIAARTLAVYMGQYLKTSIIISNVPGAGGAIGTTKGVHGETGRLYSGLLVHDAGAFGRI